MNPQPPAGPASGETQPPANPITGRFAPLLILVAGLFLINGLRGLVQGGVIAGFYDGAPLLVVLWFLFSRNRTTTPATAALPTPAEIPSEIQPTRRRYWPAVGCVGFLVVVCALLAWRAATLDQDPPEIEGVSRPGDYTNPYLGFRVRYGGEWRDITRSPEAKPARDHARDGAPGRILLALAWNNPDNADLATKVVFQASYDTSAGGTETADDFIDRNNSRLRHRKDLVGESKSEGMTRIAAWSCRRETLRRNWAGREVGMTYWVTVHRRHAIVVNANYETPEGLSAVEQLLANVTDLG